MTSKTRTRAATLPQPVRKRIVQGSAFSAAANSSTSTTAETGVGMVRTFLHAGQGAFLPANWSLTLSDFLQFGQRNRMAMRETRQKEGGREHRPFIMVRATQRANGKGTA